MRKQNTVEKDASAANENAWVVKALPLCAKSLVSRKTQSTLGLSPAVTPLSVNVDTSQKSLKATCPRAGPSACQRSVATIKTTSRLIVPPGPAAHKSRLSLGVLD